ncbi:hypothetical protein KC19_9G088200 [Ceratodon purpureus]|uniref:Uncharacterized protein n=1 Tax=Ceratodon purpureus TaxID=3225 RepID=A0A8T0GQ63_CERPU|nr:hypothetical protein KC19_9G088200 [Ceratodon purpureus]
MQQKTPEKNQRTSPHLRQPNRHQTPIVKPQRPTKPRALPTPKPNPNIPKPKHRTHIQKHIPNTPDISQTCDISQTQCNICQTQVKYPNTWRSLKKMSATDL